MKILIFCPYYPPHIGGLESHADEFNKHLSQKGVDMTVFTPRLPHVSLEFETKYTDVKIIRFPAFEVIPNYPLPALWSLRFWKLFFSLFKNKYDITISRTRFFSTSFLALIFSKLKRVRWIHIEHGSDFVKSGGWLSVAVARLCDHTLGRMVFLLSNQNVANSHAGAEFSKKLSFQKNCAVIYRGMEIEKIEKIIPENSWREKYPSDILIAFVGRLIDGKGVADLIKATEKINSNYKLLLIGDGPQKNNLTELSDDLNLNDKVIFLGRKNFSETMGILKTCDIFVNPSYTEGLPTTVIEGAFCKKAIIATNVGDTAEIIKDEKSGFLIKAGDISDLSVKLNQLANNKELREKFSNNAYAEVKDKFNWNNSAEKYMEIFKRILD